MKGLENADPNQPGFKTREDSVKYDVVVGKRLVKARIALLLTVVCYILYRISPRLFADPDLGGALSSLFIIIGSLSTIVTGWKYATAFQLPPTPKEAIKYRADIEKRARKYLYKESHRNK